MIHYDPATAEAVGAMILCASEYPEASMRFARPGAPALDEQCAMARERVADCIHGQAWAASTQLQTDARLHAIRADRDLVQWNRQRRASLGNFARSIAMASVNRITWGW